MDNFFYGEEKMEQSTLVNNNVENKKQYSVRIIPKICQYWEHDLEEACNRIGGEVINLKAENPGSYLMDTNIVEVMNNIIREKQCDPRVNCRYVLPCFLIEAPTNSGKTTFVMNYLLEMAIKEGKKLLYLVNREGLKLQQKYEVIKNCPDAEDILQNIEESSSPMDVCNILRHSKDNYKNIIIMTYQSFLSELKNINNTEEIGVVVCDEAHYFVYDSLYNKYTDIQLYKIIESFPKALRVYMSATFEETALLINDLEHEYYSDYCHCEACFLYDRHNDCCCKECKSAYHLKYKGIRKQIRYDVLENFSGKLLLEEVKEKCLKSSGKSMVFVASKNKGQELVDMINKSAEKGEKLAAYVDADAKDEEVYKKIVSVSKFENKVLVTTSVLDNGVNIKDIQLDNIFILDLDRIGNIQSVGRKRFENLDKLNAQPAVKKRFEDMDILNVYFICPDINDLKKRLLKVQGNITAYKTIMKDPAQYVFNLYDNKENGLSLVRKHEDQYSYNELAYVRLKYQERSLQELINTTDRRERISKILHWYDEEADADYLGYTQNELKMYKKLETYADEHLLYEKEAFIGAFMKLYTEYFGKDSSDRPDRDVATSVTRANNKLKRINLPFQFIAKKTGDEEIYVQVKKLTGSEEEDDVIQG